MKTFIFVCYIPEKEQFIIHSIDGKSLYQVLETHKAIFPAHKCIFIFLSPAYLAGSTISYLTKLMNANSMETGRLLCEGAVIPPVAGHIKMVEGYVCLSYSSAGFFSTYYSKAPYESVAFVSDMRFLGFFSKAFAAPVAAVNPSFDSFFQNLNS